MELSELIEGLPVRGLTAPPRGVTITDLTEDSRTVRPGSLFVARAGLKSDGKRFLDAAAAGGAVAVLTDDPALAPPAGRALPVIYSPDVPLACAMLAERFFGRPTDTVDVMGVTGTNGKTTTSYLVWQMLNATGKKCGLIGTVQIDDGASLRASAMTTPPSLELSRLIGTMARAGCRAASMEISSHALDQKRADALRVRVGVFTNLTGDHLDYHKTMDNYAAAKARLFGLLPADGRAVVNADDPYSARMLDACRAPVWRARVVGRDSDGMEGADCTARVVGATMTGMTLDLRGPWGEIRAAVPLIGAYNAMNVLQATAAAHALGLGPEALRAGLSKIEAPPGRLQGVARPGDDVGVFVDYAHSDDSLRNVLLAVGAEMRAREASGRLWVVFGCGGDRDRTKRPRMGRAAAELAHQLVVTSDNPRTESPGAIIDEIMAGIPAEARGRTHVDADRARAIEHAVTSARPGDVVVIAGKGHETEQILPDPSKPGGTIRTHFDDCEVARAALARRRGGVP